MQLHRRPLDPAVKNWVGSIREQLLQHQQADKARVAEYRAAYHWNHGMVDEASLLALLDQAQASNRTPRSVLEYRAYVANNRAGLPSQKPRMHRPPPSMHPA